MARDYYCEGFHETESRYQEKFLELPDFIPNCVSLFQIKHAMEEALLRGIPIPQDYQWRTSC